MSARNHSPQSRAPHIQLRLSRSPLLAHLNFSSSTESIAALAAKRLAAPLPGLTITSKRPPLLRKPVPEYALSSSTSASSSSRSCSSHICESHLRSHDTNKPLPSLPPSAKEIISLLNILDSIDDDIAREVARVKDNIDETRALVSQYRVERRNRQVAIRMRRDRERLETKGIDSEFWLGV